MMKSDTDQTRESRSTPTYHSNVDHIIPTHSSSFSKLKSKTPVVFPDPDVTLLGTEHDSHIGGIFHDVLYDCLIHEFDETYINNPDDKADIINENELTPDVMEINSVFLDSESTASSSVCSFEYISKDKDVSLRKTEYRLQTIKEIEFYLSCKRMLWITTLFAVGAHQFIYYDHYYISGIFAWITCILYIILLTVPFNDKYISWFSFILIIIRIFHMISIITLCGGVLHCQYHYDLKTFSIRNEYKISMLNAYLKTLEKYLYGSVLLAIISCWVQNFYVVKYNKFTVKKWKGFYCDQLEYFILEDGTWRNDMQPITLMDRLFAFVLLLTTFAAVMLCVMSISRMELVAIYLP